MTTRDPHQDPLDQLRVVADHGSRHADPADPAQIRRAGTRRRHRRHLAVASIAAAAVLLAGGTGLAVTRLGAQQTVPPEWAGNPSAAVPGPSASATPSASASASPTSSATSSATASSSPGTTSSASASSSASSSGTGSPLPGGSSDARPPITDANRPTAGVFTTNDQAPFGVPDESEGDGQSADSTCQRGTWASIGARTILKSWSSPEYGGADAEYLTPRGVVLLDFASVSQAETAFTTIVQWGNGCRNRITANGWEALNTSDVKAVKIATIGQEAYGWEYIYRSGNEPTKDDGTFESFAVSRIDNRIAIAVTTVIGMDQQSPLDEAEAKKIPIPPNPVVPILQDATIRLDF